MNESSNIQDMPDKTSDLRQAWKNACLRIDSLQSNVDKTVMALSKRNIDSSLQRLRRIFSRQIRLACLCIVTIPLTVYPVSHGNIWLSAAMGVFFIIMATSITQSGLFSRDRPETPYDRRRFTGTADTAVVFQRYRLQRTAHADRRLYGSGSRRGNRTEHKEQYQTVACRASGRS